VLILVVCNLKPMTIYNRNQMPKLYKYDILSIHYFRPIVLCLVIHTEIHRAITSARLRARWQSQSSEISQSTMCQSDPSDAYEISKQYSEPGICGSKKIQKKSTFYVLILVETIFDDVPIQIIR